MTETDSDLMLSHLPDGAEIAELVAAYSHRLDDRDWAGWAELFTDAGIYHCSVVELTS